jgi:hypothetical protein
MKPPSKYSRETNPMLLKEHRFKFFAGVSTYLFIIEEMVSGMAVWPHKFRLKIPASSDGEARTFYGKSCDEVAEKAAEFMAHTPGCRKEPSGNLVTHTSP